MNTIKFETWFENLILANYFSDENFLNLSSISDFLVLQRRDLCDEFVEKHFNLLRGYLRAYYPKTGAQKLANAVEVIAYAREAVEIYENRLLL